jgi:hypothetical protein
MNWISIKEKLPPEKEPVLTRIDDDKGIRNEQVLIRQKNLWFYDDMTMYVYYEPTHWQPLPLEQEGQ